MDYQEEQSSEIEALESIYEGDIKGIHMTVGLTRLEYCVYSAFQYYVLRY